MLYLLGHSSICVLLLLLEWLCHVYVLLLVRLRAVVVLLTAFSLYVCVCV